MAGRSVFVILQSEPIRALLVSTFYWQLVRTRTLGGLIACSVVEDGRGFPIAESINISRKFVSNNVFSIVEPVLVDISALRAVYFSVLKFVRVSVGKIGLVTPAN